jgi:hypothetical protein
MEINISNKEKRDARVGLERMRQKRGYSYQTEDKKLVKTSKIVKYGSDSDLNTLLEGHEGLVDLSAAIRDSDPEADIEHAGRELKYPMRVYVNNQNKPVFRVTEWEVTIDPKGEETDRKVKVKDEQNVNTDLPLRWTGKMIPKKEAVRKFVFTGKYQIRHINGLTYDFLYAMAKELEKKDSLMLVGGGQKGIEPLVFQRGGKPYRGFLEGRTKGEGYCLILHLTNLELKEVPQ